MKYAPILMLLFLFACTQPVKLSTHVNKKYSLIDTSRYAILKFNGERDYYIFDRKSTPTTLTREELSKIDSIINERVNQYNTGQKERDSLLNKLFKEKYPDATTDYHNPTIKNVSQYYKQLVAVINFKNEKVVYVNCFCSASDKSSTDDKFYWKKGIIIVDDGGTCYFQLKINLTKNFVYDFFVNGVA